MKHEDREDWNQPFPKKKEDTMLPSRRIPFTRAMAKTRDKDKRSPPENKGVLPAPANSNHFQKQNLYKAQNKATLNVYIYIYIYILYIYIRDTKRRGSLFPVIRPT